MSESTEMYLLTIYKLNQQHGTAGNTQLANWLGVSTASITEMIKKLAEKGLVERKGRQLKLLPEGRSIALKVIRKHRLAERLLTDHLHIPWDHAHEQSCRLEHILSDQVVDALEEFLGNPATCPHGHPIPDKEGNVVLTEAPRLSEFAEGKTVVVERVSEESSEVLRYLEEVKIFPGEEVSIAKVAPFEGPLLVRIGGESIPLSREIASKVWAVEKA
jgi:DtxR family transcriptional regulator, Mn-dependent transcriptional regulator